jgi:hypothetical protein
MYTNIHRIKMHSVLRDVTSSTESLCWSPLSMDPAPKSTHLCILIWLSSTVAMSEIERSHVVPRVATTQICDCRQDLFFLEPLSPKADLLGTSLPTFFSNLCQSHRKSHFLSAPDQSTRCHQRIQRKQRKRKQRTQMHQLNLVENLTTSGAHDPI